MSYDELRGLVELLGPNPAILLVGFLLVRELRAARRLGSELLAAVQQLHGAITTLAGELLRARLHRAAER